MPHHVLKLLCLDVEMPPLHFKLGLMLRVRDESLTRPAERIVAAHGHQQPKRPFTARIGLPAESHRPRPLDLFRSRIAVWIRGRSSPPETRRLAESDSTRRTPAVRAKAPSA